MSEIKSRLYYNDSYQGCDNKPCYFIYVKNGGMYLSSPDEVIRVLEATTFELNDDNIDAYVESRGFVKVLEKMDNEPIKYYNGFDHAQKREDISRNMDRFEQFIYNNMRFSIFNRKALASVYSSSSSIRSNAWYGRYEREGE